MTQIGDVILQVDIIDTLVEVRGAIVKARDAIPKVHSTRTQTNVIQTDEIDEAVHVRTERNDTVGQTEDRNIVGRIEEHRDSTTETELFGDIFPLYRYIDVDILIVGSIIALMFPTLCDLSRAYFIPSFDIYLYIINVFITLGSGVIDITTATFSHSTKRVVRIKCFATFALVSIIFCIICTYHFLNS